MASLLEVAPKIDSIRAMKQSTPWLLSGAIFGFIGVALGAFGAHGLAEALEARQATAIWKTAVQYQMWHALGLILLSLLEREDPPLRGVGFAFCIGILIFSGTLYGIGLGGPRWLGAITPLGGLALLIGWLLLARAAVIRPNHRQNNP